MSELKQLLRSTCYCLFIKGRTILKELSDDLSVNHNNYLEITCKCFQVEYKQ